MADLSTHNYNTLQNRETYQNASRNSLFERIESSGVNRELYGNFLNKKASLPYNSPIHDDTYQQTQKTKKDNIDNKKHDHKHFFPIAAAVVVVLGGAGVVIGRKNSVKIREKLNQYMEELQKNKHYGKFHNIKMRIMSGINQFIGYIFTGDKIKDYSLLKAFESLGAPGRFVVKASKSSLWITEKTTLKGNYNKVKKYAASVGASIKESLAKPKNFASEQEKQLAEKLNVLINGNNDSKGLVSFSDDLISGIKDRTDNMKTLIQKENIDKYTEKYFPSSFSWHNIKKAGKNWKRFLLSKSENKDVLREHWEATENALIANVNKVGANKGKIKYFGQLKLQLEELAKEVDTLAKKPECSKEFIRLSKHIEKLTKEVNNSVTFETSGDKYAGRVLDLFAGGGMPEILIPPVGGGIIAYNTFKNSEPGERKEKFIRSGGPELIGGLAAWMVTSNILAISGAAGLLTGLGTAYVLHLICSQYIKKLDHEKQTNKNMKIQNS